MKVLDIINEDFINYKKPCMVIQMPYCNFKCGKEYCQNYHLKDAKIKNISQEKIIKKYFYRRKWLCSKC